MKSGQRVFHGCKDSCGSSSRSYTILGLSLTSFQVYVAHMVGLGWKGSPREVEDGIIIRDRKIKSSETVRLRNCVTVSVSSISMFINTFLEETETTEFLFLKEAN